MGRDELIAVLEKYGETSDPTAARRVADAVCLARDEGEPQDANTKPLDLNPSP